MAAHSRKPTLAKARRLTNRPGDDKGDGGRGGQGEPAQEDAQKQLSQGRPSSCPASSSLEPDIQAAPSGLSRGLSLDAWVNPRIKSGGAHDKAESVVFTSVHRIK